MKLIYNVEDKPKGGKLIIFAIQQVLAIMAATIAVPAIIGIPTQMPAAILGAGLGTIVYLLFTKFKSPVMISSSFAFLSSLGSALTFGYCGIVVGGILAGLVYVIIAIVIHFAGTNWVSKLMPPVIIGPTVAIIGLSLAGNAMKDIVTAAKPELINGTYNLVALLCGLVTLITVVLCSVQNKFKMGKLIPYIIGIIAGYILASFFTMFGMIFKVDYLTIINWQPLVDNFAALGDSAAAVGDKVQCFLTYPDFALIEAIKEMINGSTTVGTTYFFESAAGFGEVAIAFIPVALVVFAEHIADHKNLSSIIGRDLVEGKPGLERTLLGDGVGSIAGTVFGICPNTTYGESVGCVAITRNASVSTIFVAAIMCIVISFISPLMAFLQTIPKCVMGGVCLTLYGFIAVSGLKMFKDIDLGENKNLFTVSTILIAGIGGLAIKIPYELATGGQVAKAITIAPIATALILGIIVYAIINAVEKANKKHGDLDIGEKEENAINMPVAVKSTYEVGVDVTTLPGNQAEAEKEKAEEVDNKAEVAEDKAVENKAEVKEEKPKKAKKVKEETSEEK